MQLSRALDSAKALLPYYTWLIVGVVILIFIPEPPAFLAVLVSPGEWQELVILGSPLVAWAVIAALDAPGFMEHDSKGGRTNLPIAWLLWVMACFDLVPLLTNIGQSDGLKATVIFAPILMAVTVATVLVSRLSPGLFRAMVDREINLRKYGRTWAPAKTKDHGDAKLADTSKAAEHFKTGEIICGTDAQYDVEGKAVSIKLEKALAAPFKSAPAFTKTLAQTTSISTAWDAGRSVGKSEPNLLRFTPDGHILIVSGSGGGKTVSFVIPVTLDYDGGSLLCIDPKGEICEISSRARRELGHDVFRIKPRDVNSDSLDVLGWIDPGATDFYSNCKDVANWIFPGESGSGDGAEFFNGIAKDAFTVILAYKLGKWHKAKEKDAYARRPSLVDVYDFLIGNPDQVLDGFADIAKELEREPTCFGASTPNIQRYAESTAGIEREKTWPNTQTTMQKNIAWLGDPTVAAVISGTPHADGTGKGFETDAIVAGKSSIFLCIPLPMLNSTPGLAKVIIGSLLNAVLKREGRINGRTLFLIDEMQTLGNFQILHEDALNAARGYGITLAGIVQSPTALDARTEKGTFDAWTDNAMMQLYFGLRGQELAEKLSSTLGETTAEVRNYSGSKNKNRGQMQSSDSGGVNIQSDRHSRRLLTSSEILSMPREYGILLRGKAVSDPAIGKWPMVVGTAFYKNHKELRDKADESSFEAKEVRDDFNLAATGSSEVSTDGPSEASDTQGSSADRTTGEWASWDPVEEVLSEAREGGNSRLSQVAQIIRRIDETNEVREEDARVLEEALASPETYAFDHGGLDDIDLDEELQDFEMSPGSRGALDRAEANLAEVQREAEKQREIALLKATKPDSETMDADDDDVARIQELMLKIMAPVAASQSTTEAA